MKCMYNYLYTQYYAFTLDSESMKNNCLKVQYCIYYVRAKHKGIIVGIEVDRNKMVKKKVGLQLHSVHTGPSTGQRN